MTKKNYLFLFMTLFMAWMLPTQKAWADGVTQAQYTGAYNAITASENADADGEFWYHVTTTWNGTAFGTTTYYLTTDGKLTTDAAAAGSFQFKQVTYSATEKQSAFAAIIDEDNAYAFHVKNGNNYFTNANRAVGTNIRVSSNNSRPTYEAQVFFMNEEGRYAVRSTNAGKGTWWESSWWNVIVPDGGTEPVACYTEPDEDDTAPDHAQFIWTLEKAVATDAIEFDDADEYVLQFTQSKGSYNYLLSPTYYGNVSYTTEGWVEDGKLHRTVSKGKQMRLIITSADNGKKNNFFVKDALSGKYIIPGDAIAEGDGSWMLGDEPSAIKFENAGTDTYVLIGQNGGKANPIGNDADPYLVGNYNGSNNVKIVLASTLDVDVEGFKEYIEPAYNAIMDENNKNEEGEYWFKIYTYSEDGSTFGNTKYYLTTGGTLTTNASEAGSFNLINVGEATSGISEYAFKVNNGAKYFTNANKSAGTSIRTGTNGRDTYEAQIFCLKDGRYAVRSTNASSGDWWEASWWTVASAGVTCYTEPANENAAYIWELESATAVDDAIKFEEGAYFTITVNKKISYKYLQSPAYNEAEDAVLRRTNDEAKAMKVTMTAVSGVKNAFYMQDKESGKYIVPAANSTQGTNWTVADEPTAVYFTEIGTNIYTLRGEANGYANAYGDDKETEAYRVANYGNGSQWIFARMASNTFDDELMDEIESAYNDISLSEYYNITTSVNGTKYYLTTDGTLTTDAAEAGSFNLKAVGENDGVSNRAFYVKYRANYFTNANKTAGESLRTTNNMSATYSAQVFFQSSEDETLYAVRSTNAYNGNNWENAWWTVGTAAADGAVVACYTEPGTENRQYIWQLEESEANDVITFDESKLYTISVNKEISYKFMQSSAFNEDGDNVIRRTDDAAKAIKVKIEADSYGKNYFTVKDYASGLYLTPAADNNTGTDWTFSETATKIYMEQLGDFTFTMRSTADATAGANAYGDDREEEGYRVANYSTPTSWIIVESGSENDPVTGIETVDGNAHTANSAVFDLQGRRLTTTQHGLNIVRNADGSVQKIFIK